MQGMSKTTHPSPHSKPYCCRRPSTATSHPKMYVKQKRRVTATAQPGLPYGETQIQHSAQNFPAASTICTAPCQGAASGGCHYERLPAPQRQAHRPNPSIRPSAGRFFSAACTFFTAPCQGAARGAATTCACPPPGGKRISRFPHSAQPRPHSAKPRAHFLPPRARAPPQAIRTHPPPYRGI